MNAVPPLDFTGERMVPEAASGEIFWEHVYRYRFAAKFVRGRRVLDIACGEGYGAAALARAGGAVVGVDVSPEAVAHAKAKYGIDAKIGNAEQIPLSDASVDTIVSFETIEHVPCPEKFINECARVCRAGGRVIISTPNKAIYQGSGEPNPFHISEMNFGEFHALLATRFHSIRIYTQRPHRAPWWSLRNLTAREPHWRLNWFVPYRILLCQWLCSGVDRVLPPGYGDTVIQHILKNDIVGASVLNEFAVRRRSRLAPEEPTYYIAVMRR